MSNFVGALLLSPLFDRLGRVQMIAGPTSSPGCCSPSPASCSATSRAVSLTLFGAVIFFFASAGASAAYLTASEVFPMETRALCIAFFYAIGTAVGGISGPLLFGKLIDDASASKDITGIAIGYFIGAALMVAGGIVAAFLGVKAEGQSLENIATPLTAEDADAADPAPGSPAGLRCGRTTSLCRCHLRRLRRTSSGSRRRVTGCWSSVVPHGIPRAGSPGSTTTVNPGARPSGRAVGDLPDDPRLRARPPDGPARLR